MPVDTEPMPMRAGLEAALGSISLGNNAPAAALRTRLLDALDQFHDASHQEYFVAATLQRAVADCGRERSLSHLCSSKAFKNLEKTVAAYARIQESFVLPEHMASICHVAKQKRISLSIRESGKATLDQLREGARPKPHYLLEKTIKESSLVAEYGEQQGRDILQALRELPESLRIEGLVGHWVPDLQAPPRNPPRKKLIGFHVASGDAIVDETGRDLCQRIKPIESKPIAPKPIAPKPIAPKSIESKPIAPKPIEPKPTEPKIKPDPERFYFPVDCDDLSRSLEPLGAERNTGWRTRGFTGDYDGHDLMTRAGSGPPHTAVTTVEDVPILKTLNLAMTGTRKGSELEPDGVTPYTVFQHGFQVQYLAYMGNKEPDNPINADVAKPTFPSFFCDRGHCFVVENQRELALAYEKAGVKLKNTWHQDASGRYPDYERRGSGSRGPSVRGTPVPSRRGSPAPTGDSPSPARRGSLAPPSPASSRRGSLAPPDEVSPASSRRGSLAPPVPSRRSTGQAVLPPGTPLVPQNVAGYSSVVGGPPDLQGAPRLPSRLISASPSQSTSSKLQGGDVTERTRRSPSVEPPRRPDSKREEGEKRSDNTLVRDRKSRSRSR